MWPKLMRWLAGKPKKMRYEVPLIRPEGGNIANEVVWAENEYAARLDVMSRHDTSAVLIGPAKSK